MKILSVTIAMLLAFNSFGQQIFSSLEVENEASKPSFFFFITGDEKNINEDLTTYLARFGKVKTENETYYVNLSQELGQSELVTSVAVKLIENKEYNKVVTFFLDQNDEGLNAESVVQEDREAFIYGLYDLIRKNEENRIIIVDVENAEDNAQEAEKEKNKIERSIERNLRDQEKLGKKLDASPEELTKLINEKNTVLQTKLTGTATDSVTVDVEGLDKKISKTEKEIIKTKKREEKNASRLKQREEQLEELSEELFQAQNKLRILEEVLRDKKNMLNAIK